MFNHITKHGFQYLDEEISKIVDVDRPDIINKVSEARSKGDLSENAEYHAAREKHRALEAKFLMLEELKMSSKIVRFEDVADKSAVNFGATVLLESGAIEKSITIVHQCESDPAQGKISVDTPIAKVMMGKKIGDVVEIVQKGVVREFEIIELHYDFLK